MPKKKKSSSPKPRHVWRINPKTRVKPSTKKYSRAQQKKDKKTWIEEIEWFG